MRSVLSSITANESRNNFKRFIRSRLFPLGLIAFSLFLVLAVRLFQLQIIEGAVKQEQYISQKTQKTISLSSTRGIIYDRNGNVLAGNKLIYVVNVTDNGDYKDGYEKNNMLLKLIDILDRHDTAVNTFLPIVLNPDGTFDYTCSESARLRFLRDMYGLRSVEELKEDTSGKTDANLSAEGVFQYLFKRYGVGYRNSRKRETYEIDNETALKLIKETMADVMEHSETMLGVTVDEDYRRVYTNSKVFSQLLGYTGAISTEQVEALNGQLGYDKYSAGDVVGQSGLEAVLELDLQGEKGEQTMFLDSLGHILEVTESRNAKAGEDYYLTVDKDLSVAIYNLIEQKLAGIILGKLVDRKVRITTSMNNADRLGTLKTVTVTATVPLSGKAVFDFNATNPKITAASSGAAVLGAPLNHDFCVISLSDLLTPWELIEKRLRAAAEGDFAIAIYNPSSKKRHDYLQKACDILLETIEGARPCGYVRSIGRDGEEYRTCTLAELRDEQVDMFTTVFIGNSQSRITGGRLITPRGYKL